MARFFRKIRLKQIESDRFTRYLKYAIGEVILVILGILIALALNDWNSKRIERADILDHSIKLLAELDLLINREQSRRDELMSDVRKLESVKASIETGSVDSFLVSFASITGLTRGQQPPRNHPVFNEFLDKGYFTKIKGKELESWARALSQVIIAHNSYKKYSQDIYKDIILPFLIKNLDYDTLQDNGKSLSNSGMSVDQIALFKSNEFQNILDLRLELLEADLSLSGGALYILESFKESLEDSIR